jgi:hypothetical protein
LHVVGIVIGMMAGRPSGVFIIRGLGVGIAAAGVYYMAAAAGIGG